MQSLLDMVAATYVVVIYYLLYNQDPPMKESMVTQIHSATDAMKARVRKAKHNAILMMQEAGYDVGDTVEVVVDPQLPFMGYTAPQGGNFRIVVAGGAMESGMLEGLLVHEMSHVYRMKTNHPSHNGEIIEEAISTLGKRALSHDYQRKIVHDLLNDIQDLYADDIAFKVLRKSPIFASGQMSSFLQNWVKEEPVKSKDPRKDMWVNASIMVHNARAIGQMARHKVEDSGRRAAGSNARFLSRIPPEVARQFGYFRNLLVNLKENMTEDEYRKLLADYLNRFLEIAEKN